MSFASCPGGTFFGGSLAGQSLLRVTVCSARFLGLSFGQFLALRGLTMMESKVKEVGVLRRAEGDVSQLSGSVVSPCA